MSIEPIVSPTAHAVAPAAPSHCVSCGAALAPDQRYCLECGERCVPISSVLAGAAPGAGAAARAPGATPPRPPAGSDRPAPGQRNQMLTVLAGIGVLLLAMGVGVLIGRAGGGKAVSTPAQVIDVGGAGSGTSTGGTSAEAGFTGDWPQGRRGFTVQLQTLPTASTAPAAVEAAKTAASGKGVASVGALNSDDFSSLTAGNYVIYSGVYSTRAQASKALPGLKKSFPGAKVIEVSNRAGGSGASSAGGGASAAPGSGSNIKNPAPPSVLNGLHNSKGKSYEEKSKNLPDVVETG